MGTMVLKWHPTWWNETVHGSAWDRVKEAMRRDWMETTHDIGLGGHELNQTLVDTVKQAIGQEPLPTLEEANPPTVVGEWSAAEVPYEYGYAARSRFGERHPHWNEGLEQELKDEWTSAWDNKDHHWGTVRHFVHRGYEYEEADGSSVPSGASVATPRTHEVLRMR